MVIKTILCEGKELKELKQIAPYEYEIVDGTKLDLTGYEVVQVADKSKKKVQTSSR